jgi:GNAT superfamily N-acetyltransferase
MAVSIRQATPEDAPALARMRWDHTAEDGGPTPQTYAEFAADFAAFVREALAGGQWAIWIAARDGRAVAQVYVRLVGKVPRPGRFARGWGYATAVYAAPEARNRGIGSRLLRRVIAWAEAEGLEFLVQWPSERAIPFYERAGFVRSPDALELHLDP